MKRGEPASHEAGLRDGHCFIGGAVQHVDARLGQIPEQLHRVARQIAAQLELFEPIGALNRWHAAAVGPKARPTAARADRREQIGIGHANMPRAMSAHRMAGQISAAFVAGVMLGSICERLEHVDSPPIFPVEAVWTPARRRDDMGPRFWLVHGRLIFAARRRIVQRHDHPRQVGVVPATVGDCSSAEGKRSAPVGSLFTAGRTAYGWTLPSIRLRNVRTWTSRGPNSFQFDLRLRELRLIGRRFQ